MALLMACGNAETTTEAQAEEKSPEQVKEELVLEITKMEEDLMAKMRTEFDDNMARNLVKFYTQYADNNPKDSISAEYLFKAGEVCIGLKDYKMAIANFQRIYDNFPSYNKRVESLYLVGFVHDEYLDQYAQAQDFYQKLIDDHPDHSFADDAQASIETLGLSDEEIIQRFEEKNKAKS